jgi:predicted ABC-type ATPase
MDANKQPTCYIIAGPNGAGKTTFTLQYLLKSEPCEYYLNADSIAYGLDPVKPARAQFTAGKIFLKELDKCLARRENFALETTLSGGNYLAQAPQWQKLGWKIVVIYLWIPSADFSSYRVAERVAQGGHDIPEEAIQRRYKKSLSNLLKIAEIADQTICYNNSVPQRIVIFNRQNGVLSVYNERTYRIILQTVDEHENGNRIA